MGFINFDFDAIEDYISNHLRLFLSMAGGILLFVGIIAVSIFFVFVRGAEQTMVPDVRGKELTAALLELQVKELYPRLQLRYSQSSADKGLILEQNPSAGTIVKAGRRIRLVVSQGVLINTVENYLGRNIDEVRMDLLALFTTAGTGAVPPLLSLREPFMYEYSAEIPGTILQQKPEPGTGISGPTVLELVVSRGAENPLLKTPTLTGLPMAEALEQIGRLGVDFSFSLRTLRGSEKPGIVIFQDPPADTVIAANTRLNLTVTAPVQPVTEKGEVFALFRHRMPQNPYPLAIRLEAVLPAPGNAPGSIGERRRIFSAEYTGGELTIPYFLPEGTVLILSMLNREIFRTTVTASPDLSLEQL